MAKKKATKKAVSKTAPAKTATAKSKTKVAVVATKDAQRVPVRCKDVLHRKNTDDTYAIMRPDNDEYFFIIEGIAAEFWARIDGKTSVGAIKQALMTRHAPPADRFNQDVSTLLKSLEKEKLISLSGGKK